MLKTTDKREEVLKIFHEVNKISMRALRKNFDNSGITMPQGVVIHTLAKFGKMKISELSEKVNLSNSTISGIVDRLEKQEFVLRQRSEKDRRIVYVDITPKLEELHKKAHEQAEKGFADLLSKGTPEELDRIIEGLNTLKKILNSSKESLS